jgi:hypothetical protein
LRWVAEPRWCRSHEFPSSVHAVVMAAGRVLTIFDEGPTGVYKKMPQKCMLVARDANSGVLLWKEPLQEWQPEHGTGKGNRWQIHHTIPRRLVAGGGRVYVTIHFLDSPVSGGSKGALEGTLVLMVGGGEQALERVRPLLEKISREIFHLGEAGAGTVAKLINNQLYLCGEVLFFEGLVLAAKAGLRPEALCEILELTGVGGAHARLVPRVLERRYDDRTFTLGLAEKDVSLALEASRSLGAPMPTTAAAHQLFLDALSEGLREKNFWAAIEVAERRANVDITRDEPES